MNDSVVLKKRSKTLSLHGLSNPPSSLLIVLLLFFGLRTSPSPSPPLLPLLTGDIVLLILDPLLVTFVSG